MSWSECLRLLGNNDAGSVDVQLFGIDLDFGGGFMNGDAIGAIGVR